MSYSSFGKAKYQIVEKLIMEQMREIDNELVNGDQFTIEHEPLPFVQIGYDPIGDELRKPKLQFLDYPTSFGNSFGSSIMHDYDILGAVATTLTRKPLLSKLGKLDLPEFEVKFTDEDKSKQQILEKHRGVGFYKQLSQPPPPINWDRIRKSMQQEIDNIKVNGTKFQAN